MLIKSYRLAGYLLVLIFKADNINNKLQGNFITSNVQTVLNNKLLTTEESGFDKIHNLQVMPDRCRVTKVQPTPIHLFQRLRKSSTLFRLVEIN